MEIANKVIVITGGASGLGAASAEELVKAKAKVALLDIHKEAVENQARTLGGLGITCDVSDAKNSEQAIKQVVKQWGAIHGLVNCAGIAPAKRVVGKDGHAMPLADFSRVIEINLIGSFNLTRLIAAQMATQATVTENGERGVMVNTASIAAFEGQVGQAAYSASKGGIISMALPLAREFSRYGIRLCTIAPGIMQTPMLAAMPSHVQENLANSVVFPKRLGLAEEYAQLVRHIMMNEYLNAALIRLDGAIRMT